MNLENIDSIAQQACFSTDPNTKFQAENLFMDFVFSLNVNDYPKILQPFSQTVLFVFLSYLDKKIPKSSQLLQTFYTLVSNTRQWLLPNGQFKRNIDSQTLKSYVANTLGMVLGRCMKYIYVQEDLRKDLLQYLSSESNSIWKLFLFKNMIETVSMIDNEMEYVQYRTLVCSFQEKMMGMILDEMYPHFLSIADTMKVNELSSMIPKLGVENNLTTNNEHSHTVSNISDSNQQNMQTVNYELFHENNRQISNLVFALLSEIVNFKFNITFSQYDLQTQFQNIMVSFPETVLNHLTSKQFLQSFYFMLQKMVLNNHSGQYLDICFQCLKKILLSKVTRLQKQQRFNLATTHYYGLSKILISINLNQQKAANQLFQCLYKFFHAFELADLQKAGINYFELLQLIKQKSINVISLTSLSNDNPIYQSTTSLIFKIAGQAISMSQQKYTQFYCQFGRQFYTVFLQNFLIKGQNICGKIEMNKISTFKTILEEFFFNVNRTASIDMKYFFQLLLSKTQLVFSSNNQQIISNFLYLITDICEENFYDRSLIYDTTTDEELNILSEIIHKCFDFINYYKKNSLQFSASSKFIDLAIIFFFQKILAECLDNVTKNEQSISMSSKTFKVINSYKQIPLSNEQFLLYFFKQLMESLRAQDPQKVEYILQVLYNLLLKLKWSLKRQYFIQSLICRQVLQEMIALSCYSLQSSFQLMKLRRKLFKIITVLSFDDVLDTYRTNINFVIDALENHFRQLNYTIIVFDLSGICENIDTPVIYRYFLNRIDQKIGLNTLIKTLYTNYNNDLSLLQEIVAMNRSLIADKALRMSNKQLSVLLYEIIDYSLPYISTILRACEGQKWSDVMKQAYQFANTLLDSTYVNLFLVKRKSQQKFISFLFELMANLLSIHSWAVHYPQLAKHVYETMKVYLTNCSQIIIVSQNQQLLLKFVQTLQCVLYYALKKLENLFEGSKDHYICEKLLESIGKFFSFFRYKATFVHRETMTNNIKNIITMNEQYSYEFMSSLFKFAMSNLKNFQTILNCICIVIMEMSYFYPNAYENILKNLGISEDKIQKFKRIYGRILSNQQDPVFVSNLKSWLAISETKDLENIDY